MAEQLWRYGAEKLHEMVLSREVSCREVVESHLDRIREVEPLLNALITICYREAVAQADAQDKRLAKGEPVGPLAGVPISIKDIISTKGIRTTCGSRMLAEYIPPYDATAVRKIKEADGIIIGKGNVDEFAMGSSTETSHFGPCLNPWDHSAVPGGSSGGSSASLVAGECALALAEDTGGSIRQPAAFCGCVGLKPTYGRVSRHGNIAYASSFDQIGPMARSTFETARLFEIIAGRDPFDSTSADKPVEKWTEACGRDVKGLRVAILKEYVSEDLPPEIKAGINKTVDILQKAGVEISTVSVPTASYGVPIYYVITMSEASSNLARYDSILYGHKTDANELISLFTRCRAEGFGKVVRERILIGTYALSAGFFDAWYLKATKARRLVSNEFAQAFRSCDAILAPVAPCKAFKVGEKTDDPLAMYLTDVYSTIANVVGIPGLAFPVDFHEGLPVSVQLMAQPFNETVLFQLGSMIEQEVDIPRLWDSAE